MGCAYPAGMSLWTRQRFAELGRRPSCDLAEAALLCCAEVEPDVDIDAELLRLDAYADQLLTTGFRPGDAHANAHALGRFLGDDLGFTGDVADYHDPQNGLLTRVLDRRRGLPITLAIVYEAVARRAGIRAFGVNAPGHFLLAVQGHDERRAPAILDPFHGGEVLDEAGADARVQRATQGLGRFTRTLLRPSPPAVVLRRLLNNLTRDFLHRGDAEDALWTVELKRLLPDTGEEDLRAVSELLIQLGRYLEAAELIEDEVGRGDVDDGLVHLAIRARAKMN